MKYLTIILILSLSQPTQASPIESLLDSVSILFKSKPKPKTKEQRCINDGKRWDKKTQTCVVENE